MQQAFRVAILADIHGNMGALEAVLRDVAKDPPNADVVAGLDEVAVWTREQLDEAGLIYLKALPLHHRITPPRGESPKDDLLILEPHPLGTTFTQATPPAEAAAMLSGERADLIVYGHIHYASSGMLEGQAGQSVGAVGFPFDGDPRAAYGLATWDSNTWHLEHVRVPYDVETVAIALERSGAPHATHYAQRLRQARWSARPG